MNEALYEGLYLLEKLSLAFGPSGCEDRVADIVRSQIDGFCDEYYTDKLGNVIAVIRGTGKTDTPPRLMLSAHMDEVGFMISYIEDDGTLRFYNIGGMDPRILCGRRVNILSRDALIPGIIAAKPIHLQTKEEREECTPADKMYIDIGADSRDSAAQLCSTGDFAVFDSEFVYFGECLHRIKGKALDDRLGCAVMIDTMRKIYKSGNNTPFDLYFAFTVREEVGLSGAVSAAYSIDPDYCIVLESTAVADIADVAKSAQVAKLGEGGALSLMDNGTVYDRQFFNFALDCARKHDIACQIKQYVSGGNDAAHIHKSRSGVKTIAISAPTRYLHSASCVIDINDYTSILALVGAIIADMDPDKMQNQYEG